MANVRANAAALEPGDRFAGLKGEVLTVEEQGRDYYLPFPGSYAHTVWVRGADGKRRELTLKDDVPIPLLPPDPTLHSRIAAALARPVHGSAA